MKLPWRRHIATIVLAAAVGLTSGDRALAGEVTLRGSVICNGACVQDPKTAVHDLALFAIGGTPEIEAEVNRIVKEFYPERGLDADAALKLMDQFSALLKYHVDPNSPALKEAKKPAAAGHYCMPAAAMAVTGTVREKDGEKWITVTRMEPAKLKYPERMYATDKPFVVPDREPLVLKIDERRTLKCVYIPPGKFLMGTPVYMWPYHVEEYPHQVTLTKAYYLAEIPVTQDLYEAVMGSNPSTVKDAELPVQNPTFADVDRFCRLLSEKTGKAIRLPTSAEWEYAARVGTSNPGFAEKFQDQNSSGKEGFKTPLRVKSRKPNPWGLYDMASCWWEITGDRGMYHVRESIVDPHYPPATENARSQRSGRGIVSDRWSIGTHEFITEKADYAGQKFRILVEVESAKK
jgi:formylglycine-generating enzyme required for sulfatase activity